MLRHFRIFICIIFVAVFEGQLYWISKIWSWTSALMLRHFRIFICIIFVVVFEGKTLFNIIIWGLRWGIWIPYPAIKLSRFLYPAEFFGHIEYLYGVYSKKVYSIWIKYTAKFWSQSRISQTKRSYLASPETLSGAPDR